jgi:hypothetical protein
VNPACENGPYDPPEPALDIGQFQTNITKDDVAKAAGMFLDYAILKLEQYGFHHTSHMEWDEMKRLARLGAAVEAMPQNHYLIHSSELMKFAGDTEWTVYEQLPRDSDEMERRAGVGNTPAEALDWFYSRKT